MPMRSYWQLLTLLITQTVILAPSFGQTIINVPPDSAPRQVGADTVLNVLSGGTLDVRNGTIASDGAVVNVLDGRVGGLVVKTSAVANVEGGGVHERFWIEDNGLLFHRGGRTESIFLSSAGQAEIAGGAVETIGAVPSSSLLIKGVNFSIDGVPVDGLGQVGDSVQIDLDLGSVLTATLADGTPFGRYQRPGFQATIIDDGVLTLQRSADPQPRPVGTIIVDTVSNLSSVGAQQVLQVVENGRLLDQFRAGANSRVELNGGRIDAAFHAIGAEVILNEGRIGRRLNAFEDAIVTVRGGSMDGDARFHENSTLNIEGGEAGGGIWMREGSTLDMTGGHLSNADGFRGSEINIRGGVVGSITSDGGRLNISGGSVTGNARAADDSLLELSGGRHSDGLRVAKGGQIVVRGNEFRVNGMPVTGAQPVALGETTTLSGVYADGTPFVMHGSQEEIESAIQLITEPIVAADPVMISVPESPVPQGVRGGQTLVVNEGGSIPDNFTAGFGSTMKVRGGYVGRNLEIVGARLDVTAGELSSPIDVFVGSNVDISGMAMWSGVTAHEGAVVTVRGGTSSGAFDAKPGSVVNVVDGQLGSVFRAEGSTVNISGGTFTGSHQNSHGAASGSILNISGGEFLESRLRVFSGSQVFASGGVFEGIQASDAIVSIAGATMNSLSVADGADVTMTDGDIGNSTVANGNGKLRLLGGTMADIHNWYGGSVEMHGYNFEIDGVPISGLNNPGDSAGLRLPEGSHFSGVLSDGTPFAIFAGDNMQPFEISDGIVTLIKTAIPQLPPEVVVTNETAPRGIAGDHTLLLEDGGVL